MHFLCTLLFLSYGAMLDFMLVWGLLGLGLGFRVLVVVRNAMWKSQTVPWGRDETLHLSIWAGTLSQKTQTYKPSLRAS